MEQKHVLFSALGLGVGVGLGLGFASQQPFQKRDAFDSAAESIDTKLRRRIIDGRSITVTFEDFSSYVSEQTKALLSSAAFLHLKNGQFVKHTANLSPASRSILLTGPAEPCHQMLAKAIAHSYGANLLVLDINEFSSRLPPKTSGTADSSLIRTLSGAALDRMNDLFTSMIPGRNDEQSNEPGGLRRQNSDLEMQMGFTTSKMKVSSSEADLTALRQPSHATMPNQNKLRRSNSTNTLNLDEKLFVQSLYKVLVTTSRSVPIVLYIRDVELLVLSSRTVYHLFQKMISKLTGPVLILGSKIRDPSDQVSGRLEKLAVLFPYCLTIQPPPEDNAHLVSWRSQLEEEMKVIKSEDNKNRIAEVLEANDLLCDDLNSICFNDLLLGECVEEIILSAMSHHIMTNPLPRYQEGKLVISSKSLLHALNIFKKGTQPSLQAGGIGDQVTRVETEVVPTKPDIKPSEPKPEPKKEAEAPSNVEAPKKGTSVTEKPTAAPVKSETTTATSANKTEPDNEFEKRIRPEIIPAGQIGVSFEDIGALENVKESLRELVMLPLRRPDLFRGGLLKPCKGILLFGPPGTGKTMLAKALANEAHASFINVSMSTITSKWFGEDEKNVRALFTLASKVSPTVIFVDEVDSMLGQRSRAGEHEAMRKIKNEFMAHWDGLRTQPDEHVLVLAATNRPFDLDEAIIRRFERRIMVGLPTADNREQILRTLLAKENIEEGFDYKEAAMLTEGYSGSDLKILCTTAAFRPLRDFLKKEQAAAVAKAKDDKPEAENDNGHSEPSVSLRPLTMKDLKEAKKEVSASYASEGAGMQELRQWNELYGEGGSRKKQELTYFM